MTTTVNAPIIRLDNVTKRYGRELALDGVTFEVPHGVIFALLGENGAGKTTTIRALLGLGQPDAGKLEVLGLDCRTQGLEIRQRAGCVFEKPTLYEWMTVDEIGWYTSGFYGAGFLPRYRQLAAQFELPATRKIKELSKGMKAKELTGIIHAYPTLAQINRRVADQRLKEGLTPTAKAWIRRLFRLQGAQS